MTTMDWLAPVRTACRMLGSDETAAPSLRLVIQPPTTVPIDDIDRRIRDIAAQYGVLAAIDPHGIHVHLTRQEES